MATITGKSALSPNQQRALAALISQPTVPLAAAEAKVGLRTLYRWLSEDEAFKTEYLKLRRGIVDHVVLQLQKGMNNAVNCLLSVMNDPEAPVMARVTASKEILGYGFRELEVEILEQKLRSLEEAYATAPFNGHRQPNS
jgi:hypothetical protein